MARPSGRWSRKRRKSPSRPTAKKGQYLPVHIFGTTSTSHPYTSWWLTFVPSDRSTSPRVRPYLSWPWNLDRDLIAVH